MKTSAGIIVRYKDKILLCHPTNASWKNSLGPPRGEVSAGEEIIDAAIREFREETSIHINAERLKKKPRIVNYKKGKSKNIYKKVYLFDLEIQNLSEIGMDSEIIEKSRLQIEEIDWCGFISKKEMKSKILWRFKDLIGDA